MDIEGAETSVLQGSLDWLAGRTDIKLAVCTYHNHDDADTIHRLLSEAGYTSEWSDGYMLFGYVHELVRSPYFRHGVIRAWRDE